MLVANPTSTAVHFPVSWEVNGEPSERTQSTVTASIDFEDGFISLTAKIIWGAVQHSTGREFNFCRELSVTASTGLREDLVPVLGCHFRGAHFSFLRAAAGYFVFLPKKSWMVKVTRLASTIEVAKNEQPDTTVIQEWLLSHLEEIVRHT